MKIVLTALGVVLIYLIGILVASYTEVDRKEIIDVVLSTSLFAAIVLIAIAIISYFTD